MWLIKKILKKRNWFRHGYVVYLLMEIYDGLIGTMTKITVILYRGISYYLRNSHIKNLGETLCILKTGFAQKMKFSIKDFFSKCNQTRSFLSSILYKR